MLTDVMAVACRQDTLYTFLTTLCAIVGGVFVVSGIVSRMFDKFLRALLGPDSKMPS